MVVIGNTAMEKLLASKCARIADIPT